MKLERGHAEEEMFWGSRVEKIIETHTWYESEKENTGRGERSEQMAGGREYGKEEWERGSIQTEYVWKRQWNLLLFKLAYKKNGFAYEKINSS